MSERMTDSNEILAKLAEDYIKEQRRRRRWGNAFKIITVISLIYLIAADFLASGSMKTEQHAAVIDITGPIAADASASADNIVQALENAYDEKKVKGIILRIDSPGGSPVQASYVFNALQRLKSKRSDVKVYAVCVDLCASAAYYIAAGADEIYANPSSMVGSIGVLYNGFGFVGLMNKFGAERRLLTAGKNKGFLDPFLPRDPNQEAQLKKMLEEVHIQFQQAVITGRGKRLHPTPDLFSGLIWTGEDAKNLGLIDHFGSSGDVTRDVIKTKKMVNYTVKPDIFDRFAKKIGASMSQEFTASMGLKI